MYIFYIYLGKYFFENTWNITDTATGAPVAYLYRPLISLTWNVERYDLKHPGADVRVLFTLIGLRSFIEPDGCNNFFWGVAKFFIAVAVIVGLIVIGAICIFANCIYNKFKQMN